jgi:hypothetical protein
MTLLDKFFKRSIPTAYDEQKKIAVFGKVRDRLLLAKNERTHKELLFYLAEHDPDPKVRKAVAQNNATPMQAGEVLSHDENTDVRLALAGQLVKLLPDLSVDTHSQLYAYAVQSLGNLALDEVLKVRTALASTLKDHAYTPPSVAAQLARDLERQVAEPVLRFCTALRDDDLIEILATHPASWAAEAVAKRSQISASVSKAVIETGNRKAGVLLLENKGAIINTEVLQSIVERAKEFPEWHEPLATHHKLSSDMANQLARYVDSRVRKILEDNNYDLQTVEIVTDATRRRIGLKEEIEAEKEDPKKTIKRVQRLYREGSLTEEAMADALALQHDYFIFAALAALVETRIEEIEKAFSIQKPRIVCAIAWRAGLSMRFAFRLQQELANVPTKELIYPRNGSEYPFDPEDLKWQLEFLGIEVK